MLISRRSITANVDTPRRVVDTQKTLLDNVIAEKSNIKKTLLSRLHGIKTEVTYYEQVVSSRRDNLANNASISAFDPNIAKFRKITNFVILTEEIDSQLDKDVFTNLIYEGSAKILPNTVTPNANDFFIMKVFGTFHLFRVNEINPTLIEKDSGFEIRYKIYRDDIIPENCELNPSVKEIYTFDYNHVGTDFRTVLRTDENDFIQTSRDIMYLATKTYAGIYYHRTLNTIMAEVGRFPLSISSIMESSFAATKLPMIGNVKWEDVTVYDISLVHFINRFNIFASSEYIHIITEYLKPDRKFYNGSIFSVVENMDINRFKNDKQLVIYSNSNPYYNTNRLYGRIFTDHVTGCNPNGEICVYGDWITDPSKNTAYLSDNLFTLDLFPTNFVSTIRNYDSDIMLAKTAEEYDSLINIMIDIISCFISEQDMSRKRTIVVKLVNLIGDKYINSIYEESFEYDTDILYVFPLIIYILKYMIREVSGTEFK